MEDTTQEDKQLALFEALCTEAKRTSYNLNARQLGRVFRSVINYPFLPTEKFLSETEKVLFKTVTAIIQTKSELRNKLDELNKKEEVINETKTELNETNE